MEIEEVVVRYIAVLLLWCLLFPLESYRQQVSKCRFGRIKVEEVVIRYMVVLLPW